MDAGRIVEKGSHDELIANEKSVYFHMWSMQSLSALGSSSDVQLLSKNASFGDITEVFEETV